MIAVIARLPVAGGKEEEFVKLMGELGEKVLANESGCKMYQLCKGGEPGDFVMVERYESQDALASHGQTDYFKEAFPKIGAMLSGAPNIEILTEVE